jgi:hypothetical protein
MILFQNIVYGQYLVEIIGPELFNKLGLNSSACSEYNWNKDPSISNAFATAAFR